jgi:hypothetical protein
VEAMSTRSRDWKADVDAIRRILSSEWDPIGCGVPEDEYDSYVPAIYRLMQARVGVEGLASHLEKLETVSMALRANMDGNRRVAKMLLDLMDQA